MREQLGKKRIRWTDAQRRRLAEKAKAIGRSALAALGTVVSPCNHLLRVPSEDTPRQGGDQPATKLPGIERDIRICTSKAVREELYQVWVDLSILDIHGVPTLTQSPSDLQLPPPGIHAPDETAQSLGAPSLAASHRPEQHSADAEQATPLALQIPVAPRQMPKSQRELQHSLCDVQACPIAEQLADMPIVDALMVDVPMVDAPPGDWEETPAVPSGCWLAQFVGQT